MRITRLHKSLPILPYHMSSPSLSSLSCPFPFSHLYLFPFPSSFLSQIPFTCHSFSIHLSLPIPHSRSIPFSFTSLFRLSLSSAHNPFSLYPSFPSIPHSPPSLFPLQPSPSSMNHSLLDKLRMFPASTVLLTAVALVLALDAELSYLRLGQPEDSWYVITGFGARTISLWISFPSVVLVGGSPSPGAVDSMASSLMLIPGKGPDSVEY